MKPNKQLIRETLQFEELTPEEKEKRGILGRLYGPCASITIPTRNGRKYNEKLWDYQFANNEILKEMFENGGVPMELDHPQDREETQSDKIAAMMPELPKKDKDGHLITYVDIIDTPMGRIAYQLAKYGFKLGISSRGTGDLYTDEDGNESVDPETYDLTTFDLVLVPAVKDARLEMCESLEKENKEVFKQALCECLDKASKEDKESLSEAINSLGINISNDDNINNGKTSENAVDNKEEAVNDGATEIIKSLQESIKDNARLSEEIKSLQEKLAASNARVNGLNEEVERYKSSTVRLSSLAQKSKDNVSKIATLEEELATKQKQIESLKLRNKTLIESRNTRISTSKELNEKISKKEAEVKTLTENYEAKLKELNESLATEKSESGKKITELSEKLSKSNKLVEGYKNLANEVVERYIESKARMLGVHKNEIKNKLDDRYTIDDIDKICESLQTYSVRMNRLPFNFSGKDNKVKVTVTESKNESLQKAAQSSKGGAGDDDVDDSLMKMAGLQ